MKKDDIAMNRWQRKEERDSYAKKMDHIQLRTATLEQKHEVIASTEMTTGSVTSQACLNTCLYHSSYTSYEHMYLFPMHNSTLKQP
jgi:hypothetical protein